MRAKWLHFSMPFALLFGGLGILSAQESSGLPQNPPVAASTPSIADPAPPATEDATPVPLTSDQIISNAYIPMTLEQKYLFTVSRVAGPGPLFSLGLHALLDGAMDRPHQWGTDEGSIGLHLASAFGRSFLRQNIAFGVRALDHEDPRYFRSGQGEVWSRVRYAVVHTLMARADDGSTMPAYSLFVAASTMPFIAQSWRPEPFSVARGFRGGAICVGTAMAADVWNEFWPDLRKKLPHKLGGGDGPSWLTRVSSER